MIDPASAFRVPSDYEDYEKRNTLKRGSPDDIARDNCQEKPIINFKLPDAKTLTTVAKNPLLIIATLSTADYIRLIYPSADVSAWFTMRVLSNEVYQNIVASQEMFGGSPETNPFRKPPTKEDYEKAGAWVKSLDKLFFKNPLLELDFSKLLFISIGAGYGIMIGDAFFATDGGVINIKVGEVHVEAC